MAGDHLLQGPRDRTRINVGEPCGLRYWTRTLGVSEAKLRSAVAAAGTGLDAVKRCSSIV